jgi:hypothetical protein
MWAPADEAWFNAWGPGSSFWDYEMDDSARGLFLHSRFSGEDAAGAGMGHSHAQETAPATAAAGTSSDTPCDDVPMTYSSDPHPHPGAQAPNFMWKV